NNVSSDLGQLAVNRHLSVGEDCAIAGAAIAVAAAPAPIAVRNCRRFICSSIGRPTFQPSPLREYVRQTLTMMSVRIARKALPGKWPSSFVPGDPGLGLYYDPGGGLSARSTFELSEDLARNIAINSRMLAVGDGCNYRKSGIGFLAYRHVQRHFAEEGYAKAFRLLPGPTVRK